jgi:hypothetical protein
MAENQVYGFDADGIERVMNAVTRVEQMPVNPEGPQQTVRGNRYSGMVRIINVTSSGLGAHGYPANMLLPDATKDPAQYTFGIPCWAQGPNNEALTTGNYIGYGIGLAADGLVVFDVVALGVKQFVVLQIIEDLLICIPFVLEKNAFGIPTPHIYDPNFGQGVDPATRLYVAKPYQLQQSPFEGKTVRLNNVAIFLHYTGIGARTATDPNLLTENQVIVPDYFPGDVILACRADTGYAGGGIQWMDVNSAARAWAKAS